MAGWSIKTLDELCMIARGGSPRPIKDYITDAPDGINWIKISDATASTKYIYTTKQRIRPGGIRRSRMVYDGDFILSNSMSFGRPYIMKTSGCIHDGWLVLSDKSGLFDHDYLYHFLGSNAAYRQFDSRASGSTVRNLNIDLVRSVEVPLPPVSEQKRIVAILDEAFAAIDTATANTKKNLTNAKELFESELNRIFSQKDAAAKGITFKRKLGQICKLRNGRAYQKPELLDSGKYPVLRVGNFFTNKHWYYSNLELDDSKYCKEGDLLYAWSASFGPRLWEGAKVIFHYHIWRVDYDQTQVTKKFLYHWFEWDADRIKMDQGAGTTMVHVSMRSMNARSILLPSIVEQEKVVARLDEFSKKKRLLENLCNSKLTALAELKQSILQKAFTGELTADSKSIDRTLSKASL
jgi:type I restriction enzyme, S subunit